MCRQYGAVAQVVSSRWVLKRKKKRDSSSMVERRFEEPGVGGGVQFPPVPPIWEL